MKYARQLQLTMAAMLALAAASAHAQDAETRALEEVRNTVINLLQALVEKGVMTREQAEAMVESAQTKAAADAKARADQDAAEKDAVRVTYVPETVRKQIGAAVSAQIKDEVTDEVMAEARAQGWGVPGALPEWVKGVRIYGDVRARAQGDLFADDNMDRSYPDFNAINAAGSFEAAGDDQFINTTEDRHRMVGRVRAGATAQLGNAFALDFRFASGNQRSPVSTNQTLGNYGGRWEVNVDRAAVLWNPVSSSRFQELDLRVGRFANPLVATSELIWDADLSFEGISATYALDLFGRDAGRMERGLFLTLGAFPLQEVELSTDDKWLYAGQLGAELPLGEESRLRIAAGYFEYDNVTGIRNPIDSRIYDYTAPAFLQRGNTLFNINNDTEPGQLFALAGKYHLANANLMLDLGFGATHVILTADYVKNLGWDERDVFERIGQLIDEKTEGYDVGISVGHPSLSALGHWRAFALYRYLERDAVLDAFTDSDFHLGGTDAKGYQLGFDFGLSRGTWLRLRYLTANEVGGEVIDSMPLGIDVWQLDLNAQF